MQNRSRKSVFEGLERKDAFLDQKFIGSKNHQNMHFFKGLVHGFCQKMEIF